MSSLENFSSTLAEVNMEAIELPFNFDPDLGLTPLRKGFNSFPFRIGNYVLKISKAAGPVQQMEENLDILRSEYKLILENMGELHIPNTTYLIAPLKEKPERVKAVIIQPYIEGSDIKTHFSENDSDNDALLLFFESALQMYTDTRRIPDVANLQEYFNPLVNSNVVVTKKTDGSVTPILTDTNFGKIQRSSTLGPLWSFAIAKGVSRFVQQLKERKIKD